MTRDFFDAVYRPDHPFGYGGVSDAMVQRTTEMRAATCAWLLATGLANVSNATVIEVGCGRAHLSDVHPGWRGIEYSQTALEAARARDGSLRVLTADAQRLPLPAQSVDGVFTWATLEHVLDPNLALQEVDRVLRPGGNALIAPAWNCRAWTVKKLEDRAFSELPPLERIEKALIPARELIAVRAASAFPKRVIAEAKMFAGSPLPLRFRRLSPRWDLIERYGHVSDDDAVADIDPHAAICFFRARGYSISSHPTALARILARHEPVIVRKSTETHA